MKRVQWGPKYWPPTYRKHWNTILLTIWIPFHYFNCIWISTELVYPCIHFTVHKSHVQPVCACQKASLWAHCDSWRHLYSNIQQWCISKHANSVSPSLYYIDLTFTHFGVSYIESPLPIICVLSVKPPTLRSVENRATYIEKRYVLGSFSCHFYLRYPSYNLVATMLT